MVFTYETFYKKATAKMEEADAIVRLAEDENRDLTADELERTTALYEEATALKVQGDAAKIRETTKQLLTEEPTPTGAPDNLDLTAHHGPRIVATPRDHEAEGRHGFESFGRFAMAVRDAMDPHRGRRDDRLDFFSAATGMSQGVGADGGFTVPPTFSATIWDGLNSGTDSLLGMTDNYTVTGESLTFNANAETSRATGSRYGGIQAYWIAEADQTTASKPKVRKMKLEPQQLAALVYVTDKLLNNSAVALEQYLTRAATDEINFMVGDAIVNGDGSGKPLGITAAGSLITVAKETSQAADTIVHANLSKMWARLHPRSQANAVWLINADVQPELDNLFLPVTNLAGSENVGGINPFLYNPGANTIKGRPVVPVEYCATLGDAGDIILADMGGYATGTRGGVDSAMSIHLRFDYAETCFRFMFEVDGQPWLLSALTPFKGTATQSHFVTLAARA